MSAATLVRIALPLIMGIALGFKLRDEADQPTEQPSGPMLTEAELKQRLRAAGADIIRSDPGAEDSSDIAAYLSRLYLGLYYIGRTGGRLKGPALDSMALKLQHLHHQHKPKRDKHLVAWYKTVGVSSQHSLAALLGDCPLTRRFDTRYIASALGEDIPDLSFGGLLEEATTHFRDAA